MWYICSMHMYGIYIYEIYISIYAILRKSSFNEKDNALIRYHVPPNIVPRSGNGLYTFCIAGQRDPIEPSTHKHYGLLLRLLVTIYRLIVRLYFWRHHNLMAENMGKSHWYSTGSFSPYWLAFIVLKSAIYATRGEKSSVSFSFQTWEPW